MTKAEKEIFEKALETYGLQPQITIAFEEMSELQKELCKFLRGKNDVKTIANIAEEIADVEIMLDQMILLFDISDYVAGFRESKVFRLAARLRRAENG